MESLEEIKRKNYSERVHKAFTRFFDASNYLKFGVMEGLHQEREEIEEFKRQWEKEYGEEHCKMFDGAKEKLRELAEAELKAKENPLAQYSTTELKKELRRRKKEY